MALPKSSCGICGNRGTNLLSNLMTLKTKYSRTYVYLLLERFIESELSELASSLIESGACKDCYGKLNDYDAAYTMSLMLQKEFLDLMRNSPLNIITDHGTLEFCDQQDEASFVDERDAIESEEQRPSDVEIVKPNRDESSFTKKVSLKCRQCGKEFGSLSEIRTHKHNTQQTAETELTNWSSSFLSIETLSTRSEVDDEPDDQYVEEPNHQETDELEENEHYYMTELCKDEMIMPEKMIVQELAKDDENDVEASESIERASYHCCYCNALFTSTSDLDVHLQRQHVTKDGKHKCGHCGFVAKTRSALRSHYTKHTRPPIVCHICNKQFGQKASLRHHMVVHTREKIFHCGVCGKSYMHYSSMYVHQLAHFDIRKKKCKICGYELLCASHLKRHMRTHSGEKPFECPECGKRFSQRYNMFVHQNIHQGFTRKRKVFKCENCTETFDKKHLLVSHLQLVHNIAPDTDQKLKILKKKSIN